MKTDETILKRQMLSDKTKVKSTGVGTLSEGTGKHKQSTQACIHSSASPKKGTVEPRLSGLLLSESPD